jgi:hypothetical protein
MLQMLTCSPAKASLRSTRRGTRPSDAGRVEEWRDLEWPLGQFGHMDEFNVEGSSADESGMRVITLYSREL